MSAWPWPGDSQLDVARRVVGIYRAALMIKAPERCLELDAKMLELEQPWVVPEQVELDLEAEVTVSTAARYVGRSSWAIYDWIEKDRLPVRREGRRIRIRLRDLFDAQREQRLQRGANRPA